MKYILLIAFIILFAYLEAGFVKISQLEQLSYAKTQALLYLENKHIQEKEHVFPYIWPIHEDDYIQLTSPFGIRKLRNPFTGGTEKSEHKGVDLVGTWHARILAIAGGEVIDKYYVPNGRARKGHPVFGGYIRILHTDGIISGYGHLSEIYVREGDQIHQGQIIARTGNTGSSFGEHLHLSIENINGNFLNPLLWIEE